MSQSATAKAKAFLAAFRVTGSVVLSAEAAGIEKTRHYRWLKNPHYAADFEAAEKEFADVLEAAAIARAKDGILEPVYYQGEPCGAIRKYSDGIMLALLRRFKPDRYATRSEVGGIGGGPVESKLEIVFVGAESEDEPEEE